MVAAGQRSVSTLEDGRSMVAGWLSAVEEGRIVVAVGRKSMSAVEEGRSRAAVGRWRSMLVGQEGRCNSAAQGVGKGIEPQASASVTWDAARTPMTAAQPKRPEQQRVGMEQILQRASV